MKFYRLLDRNCKGPEITVDPEFRSLIAPLSLEERELLTQSIAAQGCLQALCVWRVEDQRILLDGHNRAEICQVLNKTFEIRNIKLASREAAKLWILEHQAGRRNLTDDQRAIVWNEIREQRSRVATAARSRHANAVKSGTMSVKTADKVKLDMRHLVAKEARLPENKLRQAQALKKHQPELYRRVLAGEITLRDTARKHSKPNLSDPELYARVGRSLHNIYHYNMLDLKLNEISQIRKRDWSKEVADGVARLVSNLKEVKEETEKYIKRLRRLKK